MLMLLFAEWIYFQGDFHVNWFSSLLTLIWSSSSSRVRRWEEGEKMFDKHIYTSANVDSTSIMFRKMAIIPIKNVYIRRKILMWSHKIFPDEMFNESHVEMAIFYAFSIYCRVAVAFFWKKYIRCGDERENVIKLCDLFGEKPLIVAVSTVKNNSFSFKRIIIPVKQCLAFLLKLWKWCHWRVLTFSFLLTDLYLLININGTELN